MGLELQITEKDLPVLSVVATKALDLLRNPNVTNTQLNELIGQDPALAQRVLHIANSPFYSGRCESRKISDAIVRLGLRQLRNVILAAATGELFDVSDPIIQSLWQHSLATAMACEKLVAPLHVAEAEEAFVAGMLHDVGKFIIYQQHPKFYSAMMKEAEEKGKRLYQLELTHFEFFHHMSVGGMVIRKWRLPSTVAEAARFHHDLELTLPPRMENKPLACLVSLASILVNNLGYGAPAVKDEEMLHLSCASLFELTEADLAKLQTLVEGVCRGQILAAAS